MTVLPAAKRRRISPPGENDHDLSARSVSKPGRKQQDSAFVRNAGQWDLENSYEKRARKGKKDKKETSRLPIKTSEGRVERIELSRTELGNSEDEDGATEADIRAAADAVDENSQEDKKPRVSPREEILQAKEELARLAGVINEAPEENVGRLKRLAEISQSDNVTVKRLALATQMTVYKDIIPGYRIRPWTNADTAGRLTKEVKALRNFEQGMISAYQSYVQQLENYALVGQAGQSSESQRALQSIAIACASALVLAVPHFNFRTELIKILVQKLSNRKVDSDFNKCLNAFETLFADDEDGQPSLDAVINISRMMKGKGYNVHESVLNLFLHLRLLSDFSLKGSQTQVDKAAEDTKLPKKHRVFRTKKERKAAKELKQVSKEMSEADVVVGREERDRLQAEILKLVFTTYFQVLKTRSAPLMGAVLEGLAKYTHLINQDFFGDILEVLRELCGQAIEDNEAETDGVPENDADQERQRIKWDDPQRAVLLCTTTAFQLLAGQDVAKAASGLSLDLSYFTSTLYRILPSLSLEPNIELSSRSLHVENLRTISGEPAKVNARATATLLIRALTAALLPRNIPQVRTAAFAHRLATSAIQTPEKSALALLGVLNQVSKVHGRKIAGLWDTEERRGDGNFDAWGSDFETANAYAGTVWAGELLKHHYAPPVREGVINLEKALLQCQGKR